MDWLNYHHLLYFWVAARTGSVSAAGEELELSAPTVSGQIRLLEESLGQKLFKRAGRGLVLTDAGRLVFKYAEEIFSLGRALQEDVKGRAPVLARHLRVGVTPGLSEFVVQQKLLPMLQAKENVRLIVHTDHLQSLLGLLVVRGLDLILSDTFAANPKLKIFNHQLGESGTTFFASTRSARALKGSFPRSLQQGHLILPAESSALRGEIEKWLASKGVRPAKVSECDNANVMAAIGAATDGVFPAPTSISNELQKRYGVVPVARVDAVHQRVYAVTSERKQKDPAIIAVLKQSRR